MKIALLSAILVAGSTTLVTAAPDDKETTERTSYTETAKREDPRAPWVELASGAPAKHGREYIAVDGTYALLRLEPTKGRPIVRSVRIRYADGTERLVRIDRTLGGARTPTAVIDLRGAKVIDHLVVVTERTSATYAVFAAPDASPVAAR